MASSVAYPAGRVLAVVVRAAEAPRRFHVKVLSVEDDFYRWYLLESGVFGALTLFRLATDSPGDLEVTFEGEPQELAVSWRVVVGPEVTDCSEVAALR